MIGSIGSSGAPAVQAYQPAAPAPAPEAAPAPAPAPAPAEAPSSYLVPLDVPGDADPCTSCGREALEKAYEMRAMEQGSVDADVIAQVAATYAASRPAA
jgi:hypothetical protein